MKALGKSYKDAKASDGGYVNLPPGGYIAVITFVEDVPYNPQTNKGDYLKIDFDICEGEFMDYFGDMRKRLGWDNGQFVRSYKESALGMFKGFLKAVDESNGTDFEAMAENGFNERDLRGKTIGVIMGAEQYRKNDGSIGERLRVTGVRSVDTIREGRYKVPDLKRLEESTSEAATRIMGGPVTDADIPFV